MLNQSEEDIIFQKFPFIDTISNVLGVFVGLFYAYIIERLFEIRQNINILGSSICVLELKNTVFIENLILQSTKLSEIFMYMILIGIIILSCYLYLLRVISKVNFSSKILFVLSIFIWLCLPLIILVITTRSFNAYIIPLYNISASDNLILSNNISMLDFFRWYSKPFIRMHLIISWTTLLIAFNKYFYLIYHKKEIKLVILIYVIFSIFISYFINYHFLIHTKIVYENGNMSIMPALNKAFIGPLIPKNIQIIITVFIAIYTCIFLISICEDEIIKIVKKNKLIREKRISQINLHFYAEREGRLRRVGDDRF